MEFNVKNFLIEEVRSEYLNKNMEFVANTYISTIIRKIDKEMIDKILKDIIEMKGEQVFIMKENESLNDKTKELKYIFESFLFSAHYTLNLTSDEKDDIIQECLENLCVEEMSIF